jgi:hypothetical protein
MPLISILNKKAGKHQDRDPERKKTPFAQKIQGMKWIKKKRGCKGLFLDAPSSGEGQEEAAPPPNSRSFNN